MARTRKSTVAKTVEAKLINGGSNTGIINKTEFEIRKIELESKTNYQIVRQLENKLQVETIKADETEMQMQIAQNNHDRTAYLVDQSEIDKEIAAIAVKTSEFELQSAEDNLYLTEQRVGVNFERGIEQLKAIAIEVDSLTFDNNNNRRIAEAKGISVQNRLFSNGRSLRGFLKGN